MRPCQRPSIATAARGASVETTSAISRRPDASDADGGRTTEVGTVRSPGERRLASA